MRNRVPSVRKLQWPLACALRAPPVRVCPRDLCGARRMASMAKARKRACHQHVKCSPTASALGETRGLNNREGQTHRGLVRQQVPRYFPGRAFRRPAAAVELMLFSRSPCRYILPPSGVPHPVPYARDGPPLPCLPAPARAAGPPLSGKSSRRVWTHRHSSRRAAP
jgi:hypothetical protein